ncbi:phenylalanine ammonia-lyase 2-like [Lingula anatina]|uniref:Phenylalanine ammonia-lyase 2-like n=1 Tax=Lingula anatina TaxID=7574 RepID=A0A1S3I677_LINAN|nr:phenylalanine ammonia-lyase 2-like [Lingula anatina]|eukprot:XP_013393780.1 phenylalanine ammonia-lyase 2-like [Lingula anatina]
MGEDKTHLSLTLQLMQERKLIRDEETFTVDGKGLNIAHVHESSKNTHIKLSISDHSLNEMAQNAEYLRKKVTEDRLVIYGINTGFGNSADTRTLELEKLQKALIQHINAGMGRTFPPDMVRAVMVTRANCLAKAYSGVRPDVVQLLVAMINNDIVPIVPLRGSVSASGDLMPLGYIAAAMIGREDINVMVRGQIMPCPVALKEANLEPLVMGPKEGLAIINATSFAAGTAAQTIYEANIAVLLTQICTGLAVEALQGKLESFHPVHHTCLQHVGLKEVSNNMLKILDGSQLAVSTLEMHLPDTYGSLKQDRYSIRTAPQWLGPVIETLKEACRRINVELNCANDNPVIDHRTDTIAHGGNFQGETLSITLDQTRQALQVCGKLLLAQFQEIVNHRINHDLPPNLCGSDINLDFGFKGADTAMASYMSELDHLANPMSNHVLSAECQNQSVNSMALVSSRLTREALEILQMMLANHLCLLCQALDLRHLRNKVLMTIDKMGKPHKEFLASFLKENKWYDFLFNPEESAARFAEKFPKNGHKEEDIRSEICGTMKSLMSDACNGHLGTAECLGKGSQRAYWYIRHTVGVPFYHGQAAIDTWLEKILSAVQNGDFENVLISVFEEA